MAAPSKLTPDTQGDAWEQRANESAKAYEAFSVYLAQPVGERSLRNVSAALGKSTALIERWSRNYGWVERVNAYNAHLEAQARARFEADRLKQREQRQSVVRALVGQLARAMQAHSGKDAALTPSEINALAAAAAKVLNESRAEFNDLPTQRQEVTGKDGAPVKTEVHVIYSDLPPLAVEGDE